MQSAKLLKISTVVFTGILLSTAITENAQARDRQHSGSYTTSRGHSGTYNNSVSGNHKDGLTRNQSITTENGKTYKRSATGTYDAQTHEFNKTVTGTNGNTRTYTGTAQDGKVSGNYTTSTGNSGTFNSTIQNNDGTVTRNGSWTNQNGEAYSRSVSSSYDKDTHTLNRSVTGPDGNTRDGSVTLTPVNQ
jgi:hypothetical protein